MKPLVTKPFGNPAFLVQMWSPGSSPARPQAEGAAPPPSAAPRPPAAARPRQTLGAPPVPRRCYAGRRGAPQRGRYVPKRSLPSLPILSPVPSCLVGALPGSLGLPSPRWRLCIWGQGSLFHPPHPRAVSTGPYVTAALVPEPCSTL